MNFSKEIKKTLICFGEKIKIVQDKNKFDGYSLFKKIAKNKEDILDAATPEKIGIVISSTYFVWVICNNQVKKIDMILKNKKKYTPIYQKYNTEIGCFQLIVVERR